MDSGKHKGWAVVARRYAFARYLTAVIVLMCLDTAPVISAPVIIPPDIKRPTEAELRDQIRKTRLALIIGVNKYDDQNSLKNPLNDAADMDKALKSIGFETILVPDPNLETLKKQLRNFETLAKNRAVTLVYFAGHGIEYNGDNYLLPAQAKISQPHHLQTEAIPLSYIRETLLSSAVPANVVILDACRSNAFIQPGTRGPSQQGLAEVNLPGMFIAYATSPGFTAADGEGRNGLYTGQLMQRITNMPGVPIEDVFKDVRKSVAGLSNKLQVPWDANLLNEYLTLHPPVTEMEQEYLTWYLAKTYRLPGYLKLYLTQYPTGIFLKEAKALLEELSNTSHNVAAYWSAPLKSVVRAGETLNYVTIFKTKNSNVSSSVRLSHPPDKSLEVNLPFDFEKDIKLHEPDSGPIRLKIESFVGASSKSRIDAQREALLESLLKYKELLEAAPPSTTIEVNEVEFTLTDLPRNAIAIHLSKE
jgi:hypothetical protein